jgi:hypothetical protein
MGGDITASNRAGEGSVFRLVLLVSAVESPAPVERVEARRVKGLPGDEARRRILVADDVNENREILRQMLERVGFEVCTASDSAGGPPALSTWQPDLVLMDLRMPGVGLRRRDDPGPTGVGRVPTGRHGERLRGRPPGRRERRRRRLVSKPPGAAAQNRGAASGSGTSTRRSASRPGTSPGGGAPIPRSLRDALRSAVVSADLDRLLGLADELAESHPAAAATVRGLADRFDYDRLLAYLEPGD